MVRSSKKVVSLLDADELPLRAEDEALVCSTCQVPWDNVPAGVLWVRRAVDEGRLPRDLPPDSCDWLDEHYKAFNLAAAWETQHGRSPPSLPDEYELYAMLGTRDLRPP